MPNHYILIDGNNVAFQAQAAGMSKSSRSRRLYSGDEETTAIFGVMQSLREIQTRWPQANLLVLWDSGNIWRYAIYPDYKGTRKINPDILAIKEALSPQRPKILPILDACGIPQVTAANYEADDIAAFMSDVIAKGNHCVTLVSRDKDWLQCVRPRIQWFNKYDDQTVTHVTFEAETGCRDADQFVESKMLLGDNSDNIPGAKGIGPAATKAIFEEFANIEDLLENFPTWVLDMPKGHALSRARKAIERLIDDPQARADLVERNRKLMDLRTMHGNKDLAAAIRKTPGRIDRQLLRATLSRLAMLSILNDLERWIAPFNKTPTE